MTIFSRLTLGAGLLAVAAWTQAAPPRVSGNRPVVIDVPVPDADPPPAEASSFAASDRGFLAAVIQADDDSAAGGDKQRTPASELKRAREQLLKASSVSATVVETITLFEKSYKAEGKYLQKTSPRPNEWNMRLELRLKLGESAGSLLEVCDGQVLWTRTEIDFGKKRDRRGRKETSLTRRNVAEIMSAARRLGDPKTETTLIASFGLGGLPALIAAIEQDMKFNPEMKEETLRDRPVVVISGAWTDTFASKLRGPGAQGTPNLLPAYVPDSVRVLIDRETGIPLQILYLKRLSGRKVSRPMLTLDFLDVALNEPINSNEFDYEPPDNVKPVELTKTYVDMLSGSGTGSRPERPSR
jgi:hypothetical protein